MDIRIILSQMLMLFAMMLIGYFVWKRQWMDENAYQRLSRIVVNIFNPVLVLYGVMGKSSAGNGKLLLQNLGMVVVFYVLLVLMGYVILWVLRPEKNERNLYRLMTMFPNVGFMGIPVITSIFGNESMIYIVFYMLAYNLLLYTYGISLAGKAANPGAGRKDVQVLNKTAEKNKTPERDTAERGYKTGIRWKRMFNSGVIASVGAILIFFLQIPIPDPVAGFCDYIGNATIPLSMLLIGISIAKVNLKEIFSNRKIYIFTVVRMVLLPVAAILLLKRLVPVEPLVFGVFALQLSMPVGSIVTLIAKENGADERCCTNGIVLGTLASILTIPLVCLFL